MADLAVAGGTVGAAVRRVRPLAALAACLAAEDERRALWLAVFFGAGIGLYFALTVEPPLWLGAASTAGAAGLVAALRRRPAWRGAALALALLATGFAAAEAARRHCEAPILQRRLGPVAIAGRVIDIDALDRGWRVIVAPEPLPGLALAGTPRRLRIHIGDTSDALSPGDRVAMRAMLYPVPGPIVPWGHDFQRDAYFERIGGVGYSFGGARRLAGPAVSGGRREALRRLRTEMTRRITAVLPGSTGGIAAALITGKRGDVAETVKDAFRNAGLAHLLAIAGLHLGLVGGFVFFTVRGLLALIPFVALRYPIKKIAAAITLLALTCYLVISGAAIPTQRAFVMNGIVFAAILIDRLRISMRICAIAALVVLAISPASLVGVSFQMSFGAVVALIAVYETFGARLARVLHSGSLGHRALGYCGGVVLTTLVATAGTDPFSIYHFHRVVLYSPLGNVLAVPLSAVWTLPWGVVACLLMPFGLERLALVPMGWGIDATIWIAEHVAALPANIWVMPHLPAAGMVATALGGLWLCLWRGRWRRWGLLPIAAGLASMMLTRPPDIVVADLGRFVAVRAADGNYATLGRPGPRIFPALLAEETGVKVDELPAKPAEGTPACSGERCLYAARGRKVAIVTGKSGLPIDCGTVDALVSQFRAGFACRSRIPVVDPIDSWRHGSIVLWLDGRGIVLQDAGDLRGDRPWVPHPVAKPKPAAPAPPD